MEMSWNINKIGFLMKWAEPTIYLHLACSEGFEPTWKQFRRLLPYPLGYEHIRYSFEVIKPQLSTVFDTTIPSVMRCVNTWIAAYKLMRHPLTLQYGIQSCPSLKDANWRRQSPWHPQYDSNLQWTFVPWFRRPVPYPFDDRGVIIFWSVWRESNPHKTHS